VLTVEWESAKREEADDSAISTDSWATTCSPPPSSRRLADSNGRRTARRREIERSIREINEAIKRSALKRS
jgi:hypothetical protein